MPTKGIFSSIFSTFRQASMEVMQKILYCTENGKLLNCNVRENAWFLDKLDIHRLTSMGLVLILRLSLFYFLFQFY